MQVLKYLTFITGWKLVGVVIGFLGSVADFFFFFPFGNLEIIPLKEVICLPGHYQKKVLESNDNKKLFSFPLPTVLGPSIYSLASIFHLNSHI